MECVKLFTVVSGRKTAGTLCLLCLLFSQSQTRGWVCKRDSRLSRGLRLSWGRRWTHLSVFFSRRRRLAVVGRCTAACVCSFTTAPSTLLVRTPSCFVDSKTKTEDARSVVVVVALGFPYLSTHKRCLRVRDSLFLAGSVSFTLEPLALAALLLFRFNPCRCLLVEGVMVRTEPACKGL